MQTLVIRQGRLLDPASGTDRIADVLVSDGSIQVIKEKIAVPDQAHAIDATGCWVTPGLIELSCEPGEPGREDRETFSTMLEAAARGGFTTLALEPNTTPAHDDPSVTTHLFSLAQQASRTSQDATVPVVLPLGALSKSLAGTEQTDVGALSAAGVVALSDGGTPASYDFLRRALEYAASHDVPVHLSACEDARVNEGPNASRVGLEAQHRCEEETRVRQACALAKLTGARVHLSAVSTQESVAALLEANVQASAAIAVCNALDDDALLAGYEPTSKLNPPLRTKQDCSALREALLKADWLCLSARHRPRTYSEIRTTFDDACSGRSTLETAVARSLSLVHNHDFPPLAWARLWSCSPARALGIAIPSLSEGAPGQITVIDPNREWRVDPSAFASRGRNAGALSNLRGRVSHTIVGGSIAFEL